MVLSCVIGCIFSFRVVIDLSIEGIFGDVFWRFHRECLFSW